MTIFPQSWCNQAKFYKATTNSSLKHSIQPHLHQHYSTPTNTMTSIMEDVDDMFFNDPHLSQVSYDPSQPTSSQTDSVMPLDSTGAETTIESVPSSSAAISEVNENPTVRTREVPTTMPAPYAVKWVRIWPKDNIGQPKIAGEDLPHVIPGDTRVP